MSLFACEREDQKTHFNTKSGLLQNRTEKQIMPPKTTINWLFSDILCYLLVACFNGKVRVFQQTIVGVYYILKGTL